MSQQREAIDTYLLRVLHTLLMERSVTRARGMVLLHARYSEHRHQPIAHTLGDGTAIAFYGSRHRVEHGAEYLGRDLRIQALDQLPRAGDVREQNSDRASVERNGTVARARLSLLLWPGEFRHSNPCVAFCGRLARSTRRLSIQLEL